jgi:HAD superfamily hydrolase (TIGR01490 family)
MVRHRIYPGAATARGRLVVVEAAFFDLDKTVISRSSSLALSRPMYQAGLMTRSMMLKGAYAQIIYLLQGADDRRLDRIKEEVMSITKGWDRAQVEQIAREAVASVIDPYLYLEALDLMELHRARHRAVFIVSSSPEEVVRPLAERLGPVRVIATRTGVDDQGRYTGEMRSGRRRRATASTSPTRTHIRIRSATSPCSRRWAIRSR